MSSDEVTVVIRNRWTGEPIYTHVTTAERQASGLAMRDAVEAACRNRASLVGASLDRASLDGASLYRASLDGASLVGASLNGASLDGASLDGASLDRASLDGASLVGAWLRNASLRNASLRGASLDGASLVGAKWRDGITINRAPLQIAGLHWMVYILDEHMQIGCELHSLADWREFDEARIVAMDGRAALRFWRAHKAALLALAESDGRGVAAAVAEAA